LLLKGRPVLGKVNRRAIDRERLGDQPHVVLALVGEAVLRPPDRAARAVNGG
jgi:hypothetical protein